MIWAILATGQSMSQEIADYVRGKCSVIAVSDAYKLAPWADALVSADGSWWKVHADAQRFAGRKFGMAKIEGIEQLKPEKGFESGNNSGFTAMKVAQMLGATKIILLGFDMHGTHYFGKHPEPLRNTTESRFKGHIRQFDKWNGCEVVNCTEGTALNKFPKANLKDVL